jgi:hypothetical protein
MCPSCLTPRITDPAPTASTMKLRRQRGVRCICLFGAECHHTSVVVRMHSASGPAIRTLHTSCVPERRTAKTPSWGNLPFAKPAIFPSSFTTRCRMCDGNGDRSYQLPSTLYLIGVSSPSAGATPISNSVAQSCWACINTKVINRLIGLLLGGSGCASTSARSLHPSGSEMLLFFGLTNGFMSQRPTVKQPSKMMGYWPLRQNGYWFFLSCRDVFPPDRVRMPP